jgi:vitamin B12/bleomycin/antimicrobial peptide transport system ATP-binding/permease protein
LEAFKPSIDWGHEIVHSTLWIVSAWAACAVATLLVTGLLIRYTAWGQRFWRITGGYFTGAANVRVWGLLVLMLLSVVVEVRIQVLLSYYSNDVYSALQVAFQGAASDDAAHRDSGIHGFWTALAIFCVLATLHLARIVLDTFLAQHFILRWRVWLTDRLTMNWLTGRAYYRDRFSHAPVDNPDQRIQSDIDVFTTGVGTGPNVPTYYSTSILLFGAVESSISVTSFTLILWRLSGSLTIFGFSAPKALFCIVIVYVAIVSAVAFRIGRPLIGLSFRNEQTNAAFRYALVRLGESAEAVAFYRGERVERRQLDIRFRAIVANYRRYVRRTIGLVGWNFSASQAVSPLPLLLQAPRLFAGAIKLGDVTQSGTAFGKIQSGLSFFRNAYSQFASYDAAMNRLYGLVEACDRAEEMPVLTSLSSPDGSVQLLGVEVFSTTGEQLIAPLDVRLNSGDSLVITGPSGSGKTTLIRALAELWPAVTGTWSRPADEHETMFVSQLPYVPLGPLRAVVSYPAGSDAFDDDRLRDMLVRVSLPHLRDRLDVEHDWAKVLSPGEQQRIAFARVLLTEPRAVFLDEATSALDEGLEYALYELLRTELPDTVVVSVSHHRAIERHHERHLELLGGGPWRLGPVSSTD